MIILNDLFLHVYDRIRRDFTLTDGLLENIINILISNCEIQYAREQEKLPYPFPTNIFISNLYACN